MAVSICLCVSLPLLLAALAAPLATKATVQT
jgi:hypothetical protein